MIEKFKIYVELLSTKIIDELGLEEKKREFKPTEQSLKWLKYEIAGVTLEFHLTELQEVSNFQDRNTIIANPKIKDLQQ